MSLQKVILFANPKISPLGNRIVSFFSADYVCEVGELEQQLRTADFRALVIDDIAKGFFDLDLCQKLLCLPELEALPVILLVNEVNLENKVSAYDAGCDDVIGEAICANEVSARITKAIFHKIARRQLLMTQNLGGIDFLSPLKSESYHASIDFLIQVHECDNLDQLGQLFFSLLSRFNLQASLQMRSAMGEKNMEAHGMSKNLETELLTELSRRFYSFDFGANSLLNFGSVSVLLKELLIDNPLWRKAVNEMVLVLIKGLNSRVVALENRFRLLEEKDRVCQVTQEMHYAVQMISVSQKEMTESVLAQLELVAVRLSESIGIVGLSSAHKASLEQSLMQCRAQINDIVRDNPAIESSCGRLEASIGNMLKLLGMPDQLSA